MASRSNDRDVRWPVDRIGFAELVWWFLVDPVKTRTTWLDVVTSKGANQHLVMLPLPELPEIA